MIVISRGTPLYEQTYEALWSLLMSGEISPGQTLGDREWGERLNTSRTPVREAMRQMARDGVLVTTEGGGYQVRAVDPQGLLSLYQCRAPLAALAVHGTTVLADDEVFKLINAAVTETARAISARDQAAALKSNTDLHQIIISNCGNPFLTNIMTNLEKMILFHRVSLMRAAKKAENSEAYFSHLAASQARQVHIVDAMATRRADEAADLMEKHLLSSAKEMTELLSRSVAG